MNRKLKKENEKLKLENMDLKNKNSKMFSKLEFKDNYIEEITKQIKEQYFNHGMVSSVGWDTAEFGSSTAIQELVSKETLILDDKIDILRNVKEHDEILKMIKGKITTVNHITPIKTEFSFYQLGEYSVKENGVFYKDKEILNERIAKRLYDMLDTIFKFELKEDK